MKKKLLSFMVIMVLVVSFCATGFASSGDGGTAEIVPQETNSVTYVIDRVSSTTANASINVSFSQRVDQYSVVVFLQKYSNGEWVLDINNEDYSSFNNGWDARSFLFSKTYDDLERGATYRLKCISKDYIGSSSHISTTYTYSF